MAAKVYNRGNERQVVATQSGREPVASHAFDHFEICFEALDGGRQAKVLLRAAQVEFENQRLRQKPHIEEDQRRAKKTRLEDLQRRAQAQLTRGLEEIATGRIAILIDES